VVNGEWLNTRTGSNSRRPSFRRPKDGLDVGKVVSYPMRHFTTALRRGEVRLFPISWCWITVCWIKRQWICQRWHFQHILFFSCTYTQYK